jgi:hypothetical protein
LFCDSRSEVGLWNLDFADEAAAPAVPDEGADTNFEQHPQELWDGFIDSALYAVPASVSHEESNPAMPCVAANASRWEHRDKIAPRILPFNAAVAQSISRKEVQKIPAAKAAMDAEWSRLRDKHVT